VRRLFSGRMLPKLWRFATECRDGSSSPIFLLPSRVSKATDLSCDIEVKG
jgi:hypothetical protein